MAGNAGAVSGRPPHPDVEVPAKAKRRSFPVGYKQRIVAEADAATAPGSVGALLRREGLYSSHLGKWRKERTVGIDQAFSRKRGPKLQRSPDADEIAKLQRQDERLTERLTEHLRKAHIIIDVQNKVASLLGRTMETPNLEEL